VGAPSPPEPTLTPEEQAAFERGVAEFNAGLFYECHDTLEDLWTGVRGPSRDFFQGLIQVAVGLYHLGNGNRAGAKSLLDRAAKRLRRYPDAYRGVDLGALRASLASWQQALAEDAPLAAFAETPPRLEIVRGQGPPAADGAAR
jgi:predicted metal-dependent hydrolase